MAVDYLSKINICTRRLTFHVGCVWVFDTVMMIEFTKLFQIIKLHYEAWKVLHWWWYLDLWYFENNLGAICVFHTSIIGYSGSYVSLYTFINNTTKSIILPITCIIKMHLVAYTSIALMPNNANPSKSWWVHNESFFLYSALTSAKPE
jgi:hypothetical protein